MSSKQRTVSSRELHKAKLVQTAADVWLDKPKGRIEHKDWVARQVNKKLHLRLDRQVTSKWVTQNTVAIEQYLCRCESLDPPLSPSPGVSAPKQV